MKKSMQTISRSVPVKVRLATAETPTTQVAHERWMNILRTGGTFRIGKVAAARSRLEVINNDQKLSIGLNRMIDNTFRDAA